MKKLAGVVAALALIAGPALTQQWHETFDTYTPGPLAAQSLWEEWDGSVGVDATVDPSEAFSSPNSVLIETGSPGNDVVWRYINGPGGQPYRFQWIFSIKTFVSSGGTGTGWYIMLNRYQIGGGDKQWSLQVQFNADTNQVIGYDVPGRPSVPLIEDQWVTLRGMVDLDRNRFDLFYGDQTITDPAAGDTWYRPASQDPSIAALDLYAGEDADPGTSGMWYDDCLLWKDTGPTGNRGVVLDALPNPAYVGQTLKLTTFAPELPLRQAALFVWSVNGFPFVKPIFYFTLNANGRFQLPGPVPPGVGGLDVEFISFVSLPGGGVCDSPPELVKLR
ncbi:MAG: hypothetical protein AB1486_05875 [Planctomycetota bacterium]